MLKQVLVIAKQDIKILLRSWITIGISIMIIVLPLIFQSPLEAGVVWTSNSATYACNQGIVSSSMLIMSVIVAANFYKDKITDMPSITFSNPITSKTYVLGKFLGMYFYILIIAFLGNIISLFQPLALGRFIIYSPLEFMKIFIMYSVPSILAMLSIAYLVEIIFSNIIATLIVPFVIMFIIDGEFPALYRLRINGYEYANLVKRNLIPDLIQFLIINRIYVMTLGVSLVIISLLIFSPKKLINKR